VSLNISVRNVGREMAIATKPPNVRK